MMTTKFNNIKSLDDIHNHKLRLEKKLRKTENSISEKTDMGKVLLDSTERIGSFLGDKSMVIEGLVYFLPLGVKYILKLINKNPGKKHKKNLIVYSAIGSVLAFLTYQYLKHRETKSA